MDPVEMWAEVARIESARKGGDDDLHAQALLICVEHRHIADRTLMHVVVRRRLVDYVRRIRGQGKHHRLRPVPASLDETDDDGRRVVPEPLIPDFADDLVAQIDARDTLVAVLECCTPPQREAIACMGDLGARRDLATRLGVTEGAISHRVHNGLQRILAS
jgi:DNA-directed RNA polymerase specialized sigma24 family protein